MAEPGHRPPAPPPLRLVQALVNSIDIEDGDDELAAPDGLASWLRRHRLAAPGDPQPGEAERVRTVELREALRELAAAHNGLPADVPGAREVVNAAGVRAGLAVQLDDVGATRLVPTASGVDGALGTVVAAVHAAIAAGTWSRLKACDCATCRWAFYEASSNRSGRWCTMAICGSREKSRRAYRRERSA